MTAPLVVTLAVPEQVQERFDALRRAHFPADRLVVGAHVTLFHALPDEPPVHAALASAARRAPFTVRVTRVRSLGRGVAYDLVAPELAALHAGLQRTLAGRLSAQDAQRLSAHVTVQNKVTAAQAGALLARLQDGFAPYEVTALGLRVWRYLGGPWEPVTRLPFRQR